MKSSSLAFFLLSALLSSQSVDARPTKSQRDARIIRLPLKRLHNLERTDVHPLVVCDHFVSDHLEAQICRNSRYSCTSNMLIGMLSAETYAEPLLFGFGVFSGLQRIARMTRRTEPSEEELRSNIAKRMYIPSTHKGSSSSDRRMYIGPYPSHGTSSTSTSGKKPRQHVRDLLPNLLARING